MPSTDFLQVSTLINRLGTLAGSLTPVGLAQTLVSVIQAVAVPPPGDPVVLEAAATAFRRAGADLTGVGGDVRALAGADLPQVWTGAAAATAGQAVTSAGDLVTAAEGSFRTAARELDAYARAVRSVQRRHADLHRDLRDAYHDATHVTVFGAEIMAPDLGALHALVGRAVGLVTGCVAVYQDSLDAADTVRGRLADMAGQARAQRAATHGFPPADAVVLADTAVGGGAVGVDDPILSPAQLARAGQQRSALTAVDRAALDTALAAAGNPAERAYVLKALAAGHPIADVLAFAGQIDGRSSTWLRERLSLTDVGTDGRVEFRGEPVRQTDATTCGSTVILMARALADPLYALRLTSGGDPTESDQDSKDAFIGRLDAELQRIHDETNTVWPEALGTTPWGVTGGLNEHAEALGTRYEFQWVDDTDRRDVGPALRDAVTAVDAGHPVPVLVGPESLRHYVLLVGHQGDQLVFYEPGAGKIVTIDEDDFRDGRMGDAGGGWPHVQGVHLPSR